MRTDIWGVAVKFRVKRDDKVTGDVTDVSRVRATPAGRAAPARAGAHASLCTTPVQERPTPRGPGRGGRRVSARGPGAAPPGPPAAAQPPVRSLHCLSHT